MSFRFSQWLFYLGILVAASDWAGTAHAQSPSPGLQAPGTARMEERLRDHIEKAGLANPNASLQRADHLRQQLKGVSDPSAVFNLRLQLAGELLNGGQSEDALKEYLRVRDFLGRFNLLSPANKAALHERIGLCYLRIGEQENCLQHHTLASCLFPIRGSGVHSLPRGSRGAIAEFTQLLQIAPDNLVARWLLNIAAMTVGDYPDKVPDKWRIASRHFASDYPLPRFHDVAGAAGVAVDDLAGGSIAEDFDNDGWLDIMCSSMNWESQLRLFRSNGDGTFTERTIEAGLRGELGGLNINQTDYNNDGFADVLVLRGGWQEAEGRQPLSLLRNDGQGNFADVTEEAGLLRFHPTQTAVWLDFDGDGHLDLFVGNEALGQEQHPCELFRNLGNGTFRECAVECGAAVTGFVKGVASADYNNDGRPDLYLSRLGQPNVLLRNDGPRSGDKGTNYHFTDVTATAGVSEPLHSFPTWFFDYDNDGWEDIFVSGYFLDDVGSVAADYLGMTNSGVRARLYRNRGDGTFADVTRAAGLYRVLAAMGANFGDLDQDGWLDFYLGTGEPSFTSLMPNRMFRNANGKRFQDVTTAGGFGHLQKGHGISFADFDHDGDQDIYAVMGGAFVGDNYRNVLFENPGNSNRWLGLRLEGVKANRAAIGARLVVTVRSPGGERRIHRTVTTGGSFGASPLRQFVGLGDATEIVSVDLVWPGSGLRQRFVNLAMNRWHQLREGADRGVAIVTRSFRFPRGAGGHKHH